MWKTILRPGFILIVLLIAGCTQPADSYHEGNGSDLILPTPRDDSQISVEQALRGRRSVRVYEDEALELADVSQLLWAAQGQTDPDGYRTAPSAGALYPLELFLLSGNVEGLPAGIYHYRPEDHRLILINAGDKRQELYAAALQQNAVKDAPMVLVLGAVYERTTGKYGQRGVRYVHMEVGHAAQNVYLQAEALDLGTVFIGAFHENEVKAVLQMREEEVPLGLMPVGKKSNSGEAPP